MNLKTYDYKGRYASYWHQIDEIEKINSDGGHLEVGPGTKFVTGRLKERGVAVSTLDIDEAVCPDYLGSVLSIPVEDGFFESSSAFEVLEHVEFEFFQPALCELARVSRRGVVISVPDVNYSLDINISLFSNKHAFSRVYSFPRLTNRSLPPYRKGGHHWELGRPGYPVNKVKNQIPNSLHLENHYRVPGNPIHHFFVMHCK